MSLDALNLDVAKRLSRLGRNTRGQGAPDNALARAGIGASLSTSSSSSSSSAGPAIGAGLSTSPPSSSSSSWHPPQALAPAPSSVGSVDFGAFRRLAAAAAGQQVNLTQQILAQHFVEANKATVDRAHRKEVEEIQKEAAVDKAAYAARAVTRGQAGLEEKWKDRRTQTLKTILRAAFTPASPGSFAVHHGLSPNTVKADQILVSQVICDSQDEMLQQHLTRVRNAVAGERRSSGDHTFMLSHCVLPKMADGTPMDIYLSEAIRK